jgi:hypothetical protein
MVEVVGKEKREVTNELLVVVVRGSVGCRHVCTWRYHPVDTRHDNVEEGDEFPIVFRPNCQSCNLAQTLQCDITEIRYFQELLISSRSPPGSVKLTLETKKSMICVSKIYPRGIQYRNLNNVSRVALIKLGLFAFSSTSLHKLKISPNSAHILCFNALVFACVICSAEKSKISSDRSLRMTMLFSQRDRDVREEATISGMNDGQSLGHACFRI